MKHILIVALASTLALGGAASADSGKSGKHPAQAAAKSNNGTGWGVGKVPPGHRKKLRAGYVVIHDHHRYGLPAPARGRVYAEQNGEVYEIIRDTATVIRAIGIVADLLN